MEDFFAQSRIHLAPLWLEEDQEVIFSEGCIFLIRVSILIHMQTSITLSCHCVHQYIKDCLKIQNSGHGSTCLLCQSPPWSEASFSQWITWCNLETCEKEIDVTSSLAELVHSQLICNSLTFHAINSKHMSCLFWPNLSRYIQITENVHLFYFRMPRSFSKIFKYI